MGCAKFFKYKKSPDYIHCIGQLMLHFQILGSNMSNKMHFLFSHLDRFPENLGDLSEEKGERFHQDIHTMEERYQGHWNANRMADYYWIIQKGTDVSTHARSFFHVK